MAEKLEQRFPGHGGREIFDRLVEQLGTVAKEYGLKLDADPAALKGRVHRMGAVDVKFAVVDELLSADLDFGMLVPRSIREKIRTELGSRLGGLFS